MYLLASTHVLMTGNSIVHNLGILVSDIIEYIYKLLFLLYYNNDLCTMVFQSVYVNIEFHIQ